jgi:hypothetical protein
MESDKDYYRRWGWFLIAVTIVALVLANAVHAPLALLIVLGLLGIGSGVLLLALAERKIQP